MVKPLPPTRGMIKGPKGEIIGTLTYTNFGKTRYSVTMHTDGAIHVKHGDWLSKYSAAMYNDFTHIHEFGRMESGRLCPIRNVNLISAGETIYHIPTYNRAHPLRMDIVEMHATPYSEKQKRDIIVNQLKADYHLQGEQLEILATAIDIFHGTDTAVEVVEIAGLIAEGTLAGAIATAMQFVMVFLTPIMVGIPVLNADNSDRKVAGMQAICFALTAWAFGEAIPPYPKSLKDNVSFFPGKWALPRFEQAWKESSEATVRNLEAEAVKKKVTKKSYQIFWRAIGSDDKKTLVKLLMDARAEELRGAEKDSFLSLDPEDYPTGPS